MELNILALIIYRAVIHSKLGEMHTDMLILDSMEQYSIPFKYFEELKTVVNTTISIHKNLKYEQTKK